MLSGLDWNFSLGSILIWEKVCDDRDEVFIYPITVLFLFVRVILHKPIIAVGVRYL